MKQIVMPAVTAPNRYGLPAVSVSVNCGRGWAGSNPSPCAASASTRAAISASSSNSSGKCLRSIPAQEPDGATM